MDTSRGRDEADVLIVGAGPTGLMLADELALAGVTVQVIERQTVPSGQSRGGAINSRTAEILAMRGMLGAITEFGGPEQDTLPRQAPVTAAEVARALTAVHGPETELARLRWGSRFSDTSRQLTDYRYGHVLFAGDAAHIHSPIGGQGLNLGVQDAMNLGWKLAAHVQDRAPAGLLDSYHAERHPAAARVLAMTRAQGVLMNPPPEADDVRALRDIVMGLARLPDANRYLAGLMSGLDLRYDLGDPDPLVGARMVDLSVQTEEGRTTVSTLMRSGRGLLLELGGQPPPSTPVPDSVDRVIAHVIDSPVGTELGASPGVDRVLIRPDGHVCWAGAGPDSSLECALQRWLPQDSSMWPNRDDLTPGGRR